jgi:hypothetical protein
MVDRLVSQDTIEEKVLQRQERKRDLPPGWSTTTRSPVA